MSAAEPDEIIGTESFLSVSGVTKRFGGATVLSEVSFGIAPGSIVSLIGPNGAGKTTLFNLVGGFLEPDEGTISLDSRPLDGLAPYRRARLGLARTFQDMRLIRRLSVLENVLLGFQHQTGEGVVGALLSRRSQAQERANSDRARELLDFVGLDSKRRDSAEALSYGQQKLLTIASCLASDARLLLFDEPVAGVQPETTRAILDLLVELRKQGKTILLIEHSMEAVRAVSDITIVLDHGYKIAEGPPEVVMQNPAVIEAYLV